MTKLFFDTEFTGLTQDTTLISIGIVSECGKKFYAELTDYNQSQVNDWIQANVIDNLTLDYNLDHRGASGDSTIKGNAVDVAICLKDWLEQFEKVEFWSDCLAYDWVLLNALIADYTDGYPNLPENVYYIPFDICTMFKLKDVDPDIGREVFAEINTVEKKHNALWDAEVIKACYDKLNEL